MLEKLDVKGGDKVVSRYISWNAFTSGKILDIYIVSKIRKDGVILVVNSKGRIYQYDRYGNGKGAAVGTIEKIKEGEEETFLAEKIQEKLQKQKDQEERERLHKIDLEICYQWVLKNSWEINSVVTINSIVSIVSLPIPKNPTTLCISFEKREKDGYLIHVYILETRDNYISHSTTSYSSDIASVLMTAAAWVKFHVSPYRLEEKENVG